MLSPIDTIAVLQGRREGILYQSVCKEDRNRDLSVDFKDRLENSVYELVWVMQRIKKRNYGCCPDFWLK